MHSPSRHIPFVAPFVLAAAVLIAGCGYGEISPPAYEYARSLYSICQRRDVERLGTLREMVALSLEKQEITVQESEWFGDLIAQAEAGEWKAAAQEARSMMEDQVTRP